MIVLDAIALLKESILKQIKVGESNTAIIGFMNIGILEIHKRFRLSFDEAVINRVDAKYTYKIDGTDSDVDVDVSDYNVLAIEDLLDSESEFVPLNKVIDEKGAKTLSFNTIRLGKEEDSDTYTVIFRTSPKFMTLDTDTIPLSPVFFEALFHYVGYLAYLSQTGEENSQHSLYKKRFEESIQRVSDLGLYLQNYIETDNLDARGFI